MPNEASRLPPSEIAPTRRWAVMETTTPKQASRVALISSYKVMLRDIIDRNPSGLRLRIANTLGTHRSFLSQITNPADPTPIPAKHLRTLFELCHFTEDEQKQFSAAYKAAHPRRVGLVVTPAPQRRDTESLTLLIPRLESPARQRALVNHIREMVRSLTDLLSP